MLVVIIVRERVDYCGCHCWCYCYGWCCYCFFFIVRGTQQTINTRMYMHTRTLTHTHLYVACVCVCLYVCLCILTLYVIVRRDCVESFANRSGDLWKCTKKCVHHKWHEMMVGGGGGNVVGKMFLLHFNWMTILPPALVDVYPRPRSAIGYVLPYNHMQPESVWLLYVTALQGMVIPLKIKWKNTKMINETANGRASNASKYYIQIVKYEYILTWCLFCCACACSAKMAIV